MNDIGPFQDIVAVSWRDDDDDFIPSDTGWDVFISYRDSISVVEPPSFEGGTFDWSVRLLGGSTTPAPGGSTENVQAVRTVTISRPMHAKVNWTLENAELDEPATGDAVNFARIYFGDYILLEQSVHTGAADPPSGSFSAVMPEGEHNIQLYLGSHDTLWPGSGAFLDVDIIWTEAGN
jgi:hypothetical protein